MLLVDVQAPALNQNFDFKIDEDAFVADAIEEIGGILMAMSGNGNLKDGAQDMLLCDMERGQILPLNRTFRQCNVTSGSRLMVV
ncbi:MAG: hypothetical protein J6Z22_00375 [Lachnospiraceae bacterium]|nr:hypothetical protein [Lachnospiraceae bacterium]